VRLGPRLAPTLVAHQEGLLAVLALIGLLLRDGSPVAGLAARGAWPVALAAGGVAGLAGAVAAEVGLRRLRVERRLRRWQRHLLAGWSATDAAAVAAFSGLAEEALVRALLQPLVGLLPAALLFAALHAMPDRRLWLWPAQALLAGLVLGLLFARWGFPAAAAAHVAVNLWGLLRLRRPQPA
jgi:hypothetical protein